MKFKLTIILGLFFLSFCTYGQTSRLKIYVLDKNTNQAVGDREMVVTINDTLVKAITLNVEGEAESIRISGGFYKVKIAIDKYQTQTLKKVGVDDPRGRILIVKMVPIVDK
jgi:hypothetical protein